MTKILLALHVLFLLLLSSWLAAVLVCLGYYGYHIWGVQEYVETGTFVETIFSVSLSGFAIAVGPIVVVVWPLCIFMAVKNYGGFLNYLMSALLVAVPLQGVVSQMNKGDIGARFTDYVFILTAIVAAVIYYALAERVRFTRFMKG